MASTTDTLSPVYPIDSRLDEHGRLQIGGCDMLEVAREFGTPAYVFAEADLHERARAFMAAGPAAGQEDLDVVFASKACPCTAVMRIFAEEGLWCDVASGGELYLALAAGFDPARILMHGNAKSPSELRRALEVGVGLIVIDNLDEIDRLGELVREGAAERPQRVLIRVTPDVKGETHDKISTGQANSKFGFGMDQAEAAITRIEGVKGLDLAGLHAHIGSQLLDLAPFRRIAGELSKLGDFPVWDLGGGLGVPYTDEQRPPSVDAYVRTLVEAAAAREDASPPARTRGGPRRLMIEPGRSLVANAGVTLYSVQSVKRNVSTWVAVDGGMSDNLRPMLYDAVYEARIVDRFADGDTRCVLAGKHCESGDVIVSDALLKDPRVGDVIVTPATGAYGHAMANNYNGVARPPVIFCREGEARVVVRRERLEELTGRDVI